MCAASDLHPPAATLSASSPLDPLNLDVLVVGAGISGLTLAHTLSEKAPQTRFWVCEQRDRVGGSIVTRSADGFLWEEGPNSFAPNPDLMDLATAVGLKDELVFADSKLPRYVFWNGELIPVPTRPGAMVRSPLVPFGAKIRFALGGLGFVRPAMGAELAARGGEETVREFFTRHIGPTFVERLVEPFVSGVYAGSIDQLSVSAAFRRMMAMEALGGGLIPGAVRLLLQRRRDRQRGINQPVTRPGTPAPKRGELGSFREGLSMLPQAIAAQLGDRVKLQWAIEQIQPTADGRYQATFATPAGPQTAIARSIVLATPAHANANILRPLLPNASTAFAGIPYPPVACAVLGYPLTAYRRPFDGFGNLIPRRFGVQTLGTIWTSALFPGRAPAGWGLTLNFIGGATNPAIGQMTEDDIAATVDRDLRVTLLKPDAPQPKILSVRLWPQAIPQYTLGHQARLAQIHQDLAAYPGLRVCSNYEGGVSMGDCVATARVEAQSLIDFLDQSAQMVHEPQGVAV